MEIVGINTKTGKEIRTESASHMVESFFHAISNHIEQLRDKGATRIIVDAEKFTLTMDLRERYPRDGACKIVGEYRKYGMNFLDEEKFPMSSPCLVKGS
jgi:hypothetical protein